jgi:hypothetical protein
VAPTGKRGRDVARIGVRFIAWAAFALTVILLEQLLGLVGTVLTVVLFLALVFGAFYRWERKARPSEQRKTLLIRAGGWTVLAAFYMAGVIVIVTILGSRPDN